MDTREVLITFNLDFYKRKINAQENELLYKIIIDFIKPINLKIEDLTFYYKGEKLIFNRETKLINIIKNNEKKINICCIMLNYNLPKTVICPICKNKYNQFEQCVIKFNDYKITLNECIKEHKKSDILLKEIKKQNLIFNFNMKELYNRCEEHPYEIYNYYCTICLKNICKNYKDKHEHKNNIIKYNDIIPNYDKYTKYLLKRFNEFTKKFTIFKQQIESIRLILNDIIDSIEIYYKINQNIFNNYFFNKNNFKILKSISNLNFQSVEKDINYIIEEEKLDKKFDCILKLYEKIINKDENDLIKIKISEFDNKNEYFLKNQYKRDFDSSPHNIKYKTKYFSLLSDITRKDSIQYQIKSEFLCNMLLFPSNIKLENKIPCLSYLTYCYKECKKPEFIYSIAKKCEKYIDSSIEIDPNFLIKIFYRASVFLSKQKNYFYSLKYLNICRSLIFNNKNSISKNLISMIDNNYRKIDQELLDYISKKKSQFKKLRIGKINNLGKFLMTLKNKKYNYDNEKNNLDINDKYLYALNKFWLNKALCFMNIIFLLL